MASPELQLSFSRLETPDAVIAEEHCDCGDERPERRRGLERF
jgi:hypothetical protein